MPPTDQQASIIQHNHREHGRVVAGPGTGKSWTAIALLQRLHAENSDLRVGLLTFTRAATNELLKKVDDQGLDWLEPATVHSFALRALMRNTQNAPLDLPLRIPDSWESQTLIQAALARRLREAGFAAVRPSLVSRLEREMAAQWESLDPSLKMIADIDPALRNAYVGQWQVHRRKFGYLLLAEIPYRAGDLLEDFTPDLNDLAFLIVDEYQDLNRADIRLVRLLANAGVRVLAIGDDDQSIYGFRMAAPAGIIEFPSAFQARADYPLTISMRCGARILDAATQLIETAPGRIQRPRLAPVQGGSEGHFAYLRFRTQVEEARGVACLIAARRAAGVAERDIAVLVRSSVATWSNLLTPELSALGIAVVDTDWVTRAMADEPLRMALAVARIALDRHDSLAWWALLHLTHGISQAFIDYVEQETGPAERFGECLLRLAHAFSGSPTQVSATRASRLIQEQLAAVQALDTAGIPDTENGWGDWLRARVVAGALSAEADRLLTEVGRIVPPGDGLASFLSQLEPIGKDIANQADAVRIMSMSTSKGLTVDSAFVLGVEAGIVPHPRAAIDEERRLLYVAMTRATQLCILTAAQRRTGPTARQGTENVNQPRGRCPLFAGLPVAQWQDGDAFVANYTP
jgi:DNA helicase-2/ATP-dependent DNA helicase PcrA